MKKLITLTLFALSLIVSKNIFAQNSFEFGLRFNPEFTSLLNKNDENVGDQLNYSSHFGYLSFGVGGGFNFNEHIGVAVDILFSREGQAFKGNIGTSTSVDSASYSNVVAIQSILAGDSLGGEYEALAELNYIKLPLMLSLSTDRSRSFYWNLLVGPQFNFLEGVAQEVNGEDHVYPNSTIEPKDLYKPVTFDWMLGLGAGFNVTPHFLLTAHLRFDYGFGDVEKKDKTVSYYGLPPVNFYASNRAATHNATAGLLIGLNYKF